MLKHLYSKTVSKLNVIGKYTNTECCYMNTIDANIIEVSLKTNIGWGRFNVLIKGLDINKHNLDPSYDYGSLIDILLKYQNITIFITQYANKYGLLEGSIIFYDNQNKIYNLGDILLQRYTPKIISTNIVNEYDFIKKRITTIGVETYTEEEKKSDEDIQYNTNTEEEKKSDEDNQYNTDKKKEKKSDEYNTNTEEEKESDDNNQYNTDTEEYNIRNSIIINMPNSSDTDWESIENDDIN